MSILARHRRAGFDYDLAEHLTAGIVLSGSEVKAAKAGHVSLKGSFVTIREGEAWLNNAHFTPYQPSGHQQAVDPSRSRKLLLHRKQLDDLIEARREGRVVVPTALLQIGKLVKLEIAIGTAKKRYDKRETIKRRDAAREAGRDVAKFTRKNA